MDRSGFIRRLEGIRDAVQRVGGRILCFEIGEPASMETVRRIEEMYQIQLPADFAEMATQVAGTVDVRWSIYDVEGIPKQFSDISSGALYWDIQMYLDQEQLESYQDFQNSPEDLPDFQGKLQLLEVPNGDMVLFDLVRPGERKPIVYINHDGLFSWPVQLAESFGDYVESLLSIGLAGNEIWQLEKFLQPEPEECADEPPEPCVIDPGCPYALAWRKMMGLG